VEVTVHPFTLDLPTDFKVKPLHSVAVSPNRNVLIYAISVPEQKDSYGNVVEKHTEYHAHLVNPKTGVSVQWPNCGAVSTHYYRRSDHQMTFKQFFELGQFLTDLSHALNVKKVKRTEVTTNGEDDD
jgi:hypothetical protein